MYVCYNVACLYNCHKNTFAFVIIGIDVAVNNTEELGVAM